MGIQTRRNRITQAQKLHFINHSFTGTAENRVWLTEPVKLPSRLPLKVRFKSNAVPA